jgi:Na+/melibiose symporter-like transporter
MTLLGDLVEESLRGRASGLSTFTSNFAVLVGPPLAAALLFRVGVQWALVINALSFAVSFFSILAIRVQPHDSEAPSPPQRHFLAEFAEGIRFFVSSRPLKALVFSLALATLGYSAYNALNVFFLTQNLHSSADLYGYIGTSWAVGSIVGAISAARFANKLGTARMFWGALLLSGTLALI